MKEAIIRATPDCQIGGIPGRSTTDHIITVVAAAHVNEHQIKPTIATLVDIKACFDRIRLNDCIWDAQFHK